MKLKAPPQMASDLHRMDEKYSCRFDIKDGEIRCNWYPKMPKPKRLRCIVESNKYLSARQVFLTEMSRRMGGALVCLEI